MRVVTKSSLGRRAEASDRSPDLPQELPVGLGLVQELRGDLPEAVDRLRREVERGGKRREEQALRLVPEGGKGH